MCAEIFPLVSMGAERRVSHAQTRERGPPSALEENSIVNNDFKKLLNCCLKLRSSQFNMLLFLLKNAFYWKTLNKLKLNLHFNQDISVSFYQKISGSRFNLYLYSDCTVFYSTLLYCKVLQGDPELAQIKKFLKYFQQVSYPIFQGYDSTHKNVEVILSSFRVPPSRILYTKEILKNTKDLRENRIIHFYN